MIRRVILGAAVTLLAAAGCGGSAERDSAADSVAEVPLAVQDPGPVHVHGLGFEASTDVLVIATHTGLWELPGSAAKAKRGESRQDTMGFTVTPSGRLLGSGHPDAREDRPPHLGLIESTDKGRTWTSVSLNGEADFHVLRAHGDTVYGFDSANERFLASADGGHTWRRRPAPENLVDLAIDPTNPERLIASGGAALYRSDNGGRRWHPVASGAPGYLAWPTPQQLYVATFDGAVLAATAPDGPWQSRAALRGPVAALHASSRTNLFAALHDGTIVQSRDGGTSWQTRSTP